MAPPTKFARLNQINPEELGALVQKRVEEHVFNLALKIGLEIRGYSTPIPQLALSLTDLANYAKLGAPLDAPVEEYLISVAPVVWLRAADGSFFETKEFDEASPDKLLPGEWLDELVLVMRAAVAREKLDQGESLTPAELAILASASAIAVRALCRDGEIRATNDDGWRIPAEECRRYITR